MPTMASERRSCVPRKNSWRHNVNKDSVLEELRKIRREIEAETNNDPQQYHAYLLQVQNKYKNRIAHNISTSPRPKSERIAGNTHV